MHAVVALTSPSLWPARLRGHPVGLGHAPRYTVAVHGGVLHQTTTSRRILQAFRKSRQTTGLSFL